MSHPAPPNTQTLRPRGVEKPTIYPHPAMLWAVPPAFHSFSPYTPYGIAAAPVWNSSPPSFHLGAPPSPASSASSSSSVTPPEPEPSKRAAPESIHKKISWKLHSVLHLPPPKAPYRPWDLRWPFDESVRLLLKADQSHLFNQPATKPAAYNIRLLHPSLPWHVDITATTNSGITIFQLLDGLHVSLQAAVTNVEWNSHRSESDKKEILEARKRRCAFYSPGTTEHLRTILRVDFLKGDFCLKGLFWDDNTVENSKTRRDIHHQLGQTRPRGKSFFVIVHPSGLYARVACSTTHITRPRFAQLMTQSVDLPVDVWRRIFRDVVDVATTFTTEWPPFINTIQSTVPLWRGWAPYDDAMRLERRASLRNRQSFALVCRAWRYVAGELMWEWIDIPTGSESHSLLRTQRLLEIIEDSHHSGAPSIPYSWWTRRIDISVYVLSIDVFPLILRILELCHHLEVIIIPIDLPSQLDNVVSVLRHRRGSFRRLDLGRCCSPEERHRLQEFDALSLSVQLCTRTDYHASGSFLSLTTLTLYVGVNGPAQGLRLPKWHFPLLRHLSIIMVSGAKVEIDLFFAEHGSQLRSLHFVGPDVYPILKHTNQLSCITLGAIFSDEGIRQLGTISSLKTIGIEFSPVDSIKRLCNLMDDWSPDADHLRSEFSSLARVRLLAQPSRYIKDYDGLWSRACQTFAQHGVLLEDARGFALYPIKGHPVRRHYEFA